MSDNTDDTADADADAAPEPEPEYEAEPAYEPEDAYAPPEGYAPADGRARRGPGRRAGSGRVTWSVRRTPNGQHVALIRFSAGPPAHVGAVGASRAQALQRAAVLARQLADSPVFAAVAPPGTGAAIKAIHALATSRDVRRTLSRYAGPGARRLARALKFW